MIGWRDGDGNSTKATEALDILCHWTHTPSGDSNLRAIFRPDDWQLDAHSSPTRLADNSGYPIPRRHPSPLFTPALTIFWTPSTGTRLLLFIFSLHPSSRSLSLSLGLLCGYYNDRGDKGHLSHVRRGEQEKALNRSRGRITGTRTEKLSTRARTNAHTHALECASTLAHLCKKTGR